MVSSGGRLSDVKRDEVLRILALHRDELRAAGVRSLSLFGSVVRGEAGPESDVDFLVEFEGPVGLFELIGLKLRLAEWLGRNVDLGTPNSLKPRVRAEVLREAVRVA